MRGFMLEKGASESRSESNVVYAQSGPSAFLLFRMRRQVRALHPLHCTAVILGTKTPCRTITLNKSLPPIAIRRGSFTGCLCRRCCLNKIKTTAATVSFGRRQEFIARGDALPDYWKFQRRSNCVLADQITLAATNSFGRDPPDA